MTFLGKTTEKCLLVCGVSSKNVKSIKCGKAEWDIQEATPEKGSNFLALTLFPDDDQIRTHRIRYLTDKQVVILKRCSEYEERNHNASKENRPSVFPAGKINDWMGLDIVPSWVGLIKEYRKAADILSESYFSVPAPFLYMCRHTLELQLKQILWLNKEMKTDTDFKINHQLDELWKKAFPIVQSFNEELKEDSNFVNEVILGYHKIDQYSTSLRYPSDKNNELIKHQKYLQSFSKSLHTEKFQRASDALETVIFSIEIKKIFYFDLDMPYSDIGDIDLTQI